jgi:GNAT superfamily N-acetyltransferase
MRTICPVSIRSALPEDGTRILNMLKSLASFEGSPCPPQLSLATLASDVFTSAPTLRVFVAEDEEHRLLGCVSYFENYSTWVARRGIHICDLWVEPDARGQGIGGALLNHVVSQHESQRIDVFVLRKNKARNFYEHLGFSERKEWCLYRRDPERVAAEG